MALSPARAPVVFYLSSCSTLDLPSESDAKRVSQNTESETASHASSAAGAPSVALTIARNAEITSKTDAAPSLSLAISESTPSQTATQTQPRRVAQFHPDPSDPSSFALTHAMSLLPVSLLQHTQQQQQQSIGKSCPLVEMAKELVCTILLPMIDAKTMFRLSVTCKKMNTLCQERFPNDERNALSVFVCF